MGGDRLQQSRDPPPEGAPGGCDDDKAQKRRDEHDVVCDDEEYLTDNAFHADDRQERPEVGNAVGSSTAMIPAPRTIDDRPRGVDVLRIRARSRSRKIQKDRGGCEQANANDKLDDMLRVRRRMGDLRDERAAECKYGTSPVTVEDRKTPAANNATRRTGCSPSARTTAGPTVDGLSESSAAIESTMAVIAPTSQSLSHDCGPAAAVTMSAVYGNVTRRRRARADAGDYVRNTTSHHGALTAVTQVVVFEMVAHVQLAQQAPETARETARGEARSKTCRRRRYPAKKPAATDHAGLQPDDARRRGRRRAVARRH